VMTATDPRWSSWKPAPAQAGVARERGLVAILDVDADQPPAHAQASWSSGWAAHGAEALGQHAEGGEVERHPGAGGLHIAPVLGACPGEGRGG
jgi:hypothetical protein